MRQSFYWGASTSGPHRLAYLEWGEPNDHPLICVHGLTRNAHDFDELAYALSQRGYYVVCPDIVGRGDSDCLPQPQQYNYPQYLADLSLLLNHLKCSKVDWLGTSMGGLLGMFLAALPNTPIQRLILNDVGPYIPRSALLRLAQYVGNNPIFDNPSVAEIYFKTVFAQFGPLSEQQWHKLTLNSIKQQPDGKWVLKVDPAIKITLPRAQLLVQAVAHPWQALTGRLGDINLWSTWRQVKCPVWVLHGVSSDILLPNTLERMQRLHPQMQWVDIANTGHAPALMSAEQIELIQQWLQCN